LRKRKRRSTPTSSAINSFSLWGEPIRSRSSRNFMVSYYVLPLLIPHSFCRFRGIWEWMTWLPSVFLPLHLMHRFEFSIVIRGSGSSWAITLGWLYLDIFLLGPWTLHELWPLWWLLGAPKLWRFLKLENFCGWFIRSVQLSCGNYCTKIVRVWCHHQGSPSGSWHLPLCKITRRLRWAIVALGRVFCFHTISTETGFLLKVNFSVHRHLCIPSVIPILEFFIYAPYFVVAFVFEVIYVTII
jgi:hypothetical protein